MFVQNSRPRAGLGSGNFFRPKSEIFGDFDVFLDSKVIGPADAHLAKIDFVLNVHVERLVIRATGKSRVEVKIVVVNLDGGCSYGYKLYFLGSYPHQCGYPPGFVYLICFIPTYILFLQEVRVAQVT